MTMTRRQYATPRRHMTMTRRVNGRTPRLKVRGLNAEPSTTPPEEGSDPENPFFKNSTRETNGLRSRNPLKTVFPDRSLAFRFLSKKAVDAITPM